MNRTTGQEIRAALNGEIESRQAEARTVGDADAIDALCEFRITVNRILHAAGEELIAGDGTERSDARDG